MCLNVCLLTSDPCWPVSPPAALLRESNRRLLSTASTAARTFCPPTCPPSTPQLPCESPQRPLLLPYLNRSLHRSSLSLRALQLVSAPSKLTPPFPQIFSASLDAQGFLRSGAPAGGELSIAVSLKVVQVLMSVCPLQRRSSPSPSWRPCIPGRFWSPGSLSCSGTPAASTSAAWPPASCPRARRPPTTRRPWRSCGGWPAVTATTAPAPRGLPPRKRTRTEGRSWTWTRTSPGVLQELLEFPEPVLVVSQNEAPPTQLPVK